MSKYTTEVRWICEQAYNNARQSDGSLPDVNIASISQIVKKAIDVIFDKDEDEFPIYDEEHRNELCSKIIKHYYTREIGAETFGLWKLWLNNRMREIMPYYNQLYESADIKYNPLYDVDYVKLGSKDGKTKHENRIEEIRQNNEAENATKTSDSNYSGSKLGQTNIEGEYENENNAVGVNSTNNVVNGRTDSSGVNNTSSDNVSKYSDTPQNGLSGLMNDTYLTNATVENNNSNSVKTDSATKEQTENTSENSSEIKNNKGNNSENQTNAESEVREFGNSENSNKTILSTGNNNSNEQGTNEDNQVWQEKVIGKYGIKTYAKMIQEYREAMLNIDLMIINELSDLFFRLW